MRGMMVYYTPRTVVLCEQCAEYFRRDGDCHLVGDAPPFSVCEGCEEGDQILPATAAPWICVGKFAVATLAIVASVTQTFAGNLPAAVGWGVAVALAMALIREDLR